MVVPSWCLSAMLVAVTSFWGWLAIRVIEQGRKLVELEAKFITREKACDEKFNDRFQRLSTLEEKIDDMPKRLIELLVDFGVIKGGKENGTC